MKRLILYIVVSLALSAGIAWLAGLPGTLSVDVAGYRAQPGLGTVALAMILLAGVAIAAWAIVRRVLDVPRRLAQHTRQKRKDQGIGALSDGFIALQSGEAVRARQLAREAQARLPGNSAAQLLEARAALAQGDMGAARDQYRALISDPKTALAALSGLYDQARAQARPQAALTFARKAAQLDKSITWAQQAVFEDLTARRAWDEALEMVGAEPARGRNEKQAKRRRQAVLLTARALDLEAHEPLGALDAALSALKLVPDFVPAALIGARLESNRGEVRKASSLLRRVWRATGHPQIAELYGHASPGVSAVERFGRVRELIGAAPDTREAAMVLAGAAAEAFEWEVGRDVLAVHAAGAPTQGVCLLMAEIEEGQNGDQGKAREWLARAVRASRDPVWTADGATAEEWAPLSPVSGAFDAFEWKVPVNQVPGRLRGVEEVRPDEGTSARALPAGSDQNTG